MNSFLAIVRRHEFSFPEHTNGHELGISVKEADVFVQEQLVDGISTVYEFG
jgi:hypothetical protein